MELKTYRLDYIKHCPYKVVGQNNSGIYAFIYKGEVVYVGQSRDLAKRLISHLKHTFTPSEKQLKSKSKEYLKYRFFKEHEHQIKYLFFSVGESELNQTERYYIEKYQPVYNYKLNPRYERSK